MPLKVKVLTVSRALKFARKFAGNFHLRRGKEKEAHSHERRLCKEGQLVDESPIGEDTFSLPKAARHILFHRISTRVVVHFSDLIWRDQCIAETLCIRFEGQSEHGGAYRQEASKSICEGLLMHTNGDARAQTFNDF